MGFVGDGGYIEVLGSDGDDPLGGADFDAAVAHWLRLIVLRSTKVSDRAMDDGSRWSGVKGKADSRWWFLCSGASSHLRSSCSLPVALVVRPSSWQWHRIVSFVGIIPHDE